MKYHVSKRKYGKFIGLKERADELRKLRRKGKSYDEIGKLFGCSSAAIYWVINGRLSRYFKKKTPPTGRGASQHAGRPNSSTGPR
jgi:DNA invertase Pin-like site-specific DNA recombinase